MMTTPDPLCLILIPNNKKKDASGRVIDFEAVYHRLIVPAVEDAGMVPVRADEERTGGMMDASMYEQLLLCEFAVADFTTADPAICYQVGVRHALKPHGTVPVYAAGSAQLPFDLEQLEGVPYRVSPLGFPVYEMIDRATLTGRLLAARKGYVDSPPFQLLKGFPNLDEQALREMREKMEHSAQLKNRLMEARKQGVEAVREVAQSLGNLMEADPGVTVELFFSYRAVEAWDEMIALVPQIPPVAAQTVLLQEQLALAMNMAGRGEEAEQLLRGLIARRGPGSGSYGTLGRILKRRWKQALADGDNALAKELLTKAIAAYVKGFEADWRDTYAGVNAVTLMELKDPPDPRRRDILPVVHHAVEQRVRSGAADYWDYATLLELAALSFDEAKGVDALGRTLARVRNAWEPETTAGDLRLMREARQRRGVETPAWVDRAEAEIMKAVERGTARP
jgi:hypothetical protein